MSASSQPPLTIAMASQLLGLDAREEPEEPRFAIIGPIEDGRQAREWALVLQSQAISYIMARGPGGWLLQVAPHDHERAMHMIDLYEVENENWPPAPVRDTPRHEHTPIIMLAFASALLFFLYVTGPASTVSRWFIHGRADAVLLFKEPWRMITALTLHADAKHIIGNALSGSIFGSMLARRVGPGGALLSVVFAGALGNAANALYYLNIHEGHRSIGASTAVFGALGMLAAVQTMLDLSRSRRGEGNPLRRMRLIDLLAPVVGGLALLGALGSGGKGTDLGAHGFGFAAGVVMGVVVGLVVRRPDRQPSNIVQLACGAAALALLGGAWALAI